MESVVAEFSGSKAGTMKSTGGMIQNGYSMGVGQKMKSSMQ